MKQLKVALMAMLVLGIAFSLAYAGNVEKGKKLFNDPKLGGSKNAKSCGSCHPPKPLRGKKRTFTIMGEKQNSPEDAVNFCIKMALKGKGIAKDSDEMKDIVAYMKTLNIKKKKKKAAIGC